MTIKNIKKVCSTIRRTCTASDHRLSSVFVEVILNTETGELSMYEHCDAYSRVELDDDEIHVNTYGYAVSMKTIREDAEEALGWHNMYKDLRR